jgi:hypothetical protein
MRRSESVTQRNRGWRPEDRNVTRLSRRQAGIERHAIELRHELRLRDTEALDQYAALATIPNCEVWAIKNVPGISIDSLAHFRTDGYNCAAWAVPDDYGGVAVFFNDEHHPRDVRVYLMEEFFHLRLRHPPDTVRVYKHSGRHRTFDRNKEDEAYGCGIAALVPYTGLELMVWQGLHIERIAEKFVVPVPIVQVRLEVTGLGELMNSPVQQLPLLAQAY